MTTPDNPLTAVTHHDPYSYYAKLVKKHPLYWDSGLNMWIASSAKSVAAVLEHHGCRVRPANEPVPTALQGTPAGKLFGSLVRMTDGESHCPLKQVVTTTLATLEEDHIADQSRGCASYLLEEIAPLEPAGLTEFTLRLPAYSVAALLGFSSDQWPALARWTGDLARCIAPGTTITQMERGQHAARELQAMTARLLETHSAASPSLLTQLTAQARARGIDSAVIAANVIGFLLQAHDATAGLIGNTLMALGREPHLHHRVREEPTLLPAVLREVLRHDAPIQNTRRFVAYDEIIAGESMQAGDTILVLLAAANRDSARHVDPERFDPARQSQHCFTFGLGRHACPGETLALAIAEAGVAELLRSGVSLEALAGEVMYRESLNARIPLFRSSHVTLSSTA
ncbi:cytochrome P450 [Halomonas sp. MCCC 1A17488]|uniref:cytochrome P450 n=1 Tax=unclassified Halomonas TaxID=2609666 RepID=UPI0018D2062A|nr:MULTISPECIES: cytochrome P450 [unclassified Halomonas]MCE8016516.1 cytochrome P450 [Halomonas sp. MCCC 1A17488]MCG3239849.1 cytochrome P450 [Halomonas sp. MCCC 1A17488]QPP50252.1 cytochrome P450 [Halomonas sp. SS10-MC5]